MHDAQPNDSQPDALHSGRQELIPWLLWWQFRPLLPITLIGVLLAGGLVIFEPEPLEASRLSRSSDLVRLFVIGHCVWLAVAEGRTSSQSFGFLYALGFTRGQLWWHGTLAASLSVFFVWLPIAWGIWSGCRSWLQDKWQNVWFPWSHKFEVGFPLVVLVLYVILVPTLRYVWLRRATPYAGRFSGTLLVGSVLIVLWQTLDSRHFGRTPDAFAQVMLSLLSLAAVALLVAGARLHGDVEVRS